MATRRHRKLWEQDDHYLRKHHSKHEKKHKKKPVFGCPECKRIAREPEAPISEFQRLNREIRKVGTNANRLYDQAEKLLILAERYVNGDDE